MKFDESDISNSIPQLIGGMKTAFATSLLGMFASISLKAYYSRQDDKNIGGSENPIDCLRNIEKAIVSCFKSEEEYSLVSQVKLIRQELIDSRRETKAAFQDFADHFSKMASESLVKELQQVVDKFNAMLNDLVSESFKDLSESTTRLNQWQHDYKGVIEKNQSQLADTITHVDKLISLLEDSVARIKEFDVTLKSIDSSLSTISTSSTELDEHTKMISSNNMLLESSMRSIRDIGVEASKVVPEISSKMNLLIDEIKILQNNTTSFVDRTTKNLEDSIRLIIATLSDNQETLHKATNDFVSSTTNELKNNFETLSIHTKDNIQAIEKSLEEELTKSLNSLAGALTALSNQFVSDYTPLTERLREVIKLAENSNANRN